MSVIKNSASIACIFFVLCCPILAKEVGRAPRFGICFSNLQNIFVLGEDLNDRKVWRLAITLNETGTNEMQRFTQEHVGEITEVVFDGAVLARMRIDAVVDSGKVLSDVWHSNATAKEAMMLIGNTSLDAPCGVLRD